MAATGGFGARALTASRTPAPAARLHYRNFRSNSEKRTEPVDIVVKNLDKAKPKQHSDARVNRELTITDVLRYSNR